MELSKMFDVDRDVEFKVKGYEVDFIIICGSTPDGKEIERLWYHGINGFVKVDNNEMLLKIIRDAPDNIIHLPPPLTDEQREQLKAIWTLGGRWIAKDVTGDTFAFGFKPVKNNGWLSLMLPTDDKNEMLFSLNKYLNVCDIVSWSDPEPYDIGKALGVEG